MSLARALTKLYAVVDYDTDPRGVPRLDESALILPGTIGEIICQVIQPRTNIRVTTILFEDKFAYVGDTAWEPVV